METIDNAIDYHLYNIFSDTGIPSNWLRTLILGKNYVFDNDTIVSVISLDDSEVIINSFSKTNSFPLAALLHILKIIKHNQDKSVFITTTNDKVIERLTGKYGFDYDSKNKCLYRRIA